MAEEELEELKKANATLGCIYWMMLLPILFSMLMLVVTWLAYCASLPRVPHG